VTEFDRATALRAVGPGRFEGLLDPGWRVGSAVNGGILMATASRAMSQAFAPHGHGDPFSLSGYFLSVSTPGQIDIDVETLRQGGTLTTGQATVRQGGTARLSVLATYGTFDGLSDDIRTVSSPPQLPPPEECVSADDGHRSLMGSFADLLDRLDVRLEPASVAWAQGKPSGRGLVQGWLRMADGREPDVHQLVFATDALFPVTYDLGVFGWAPTLELTVHVRAVPAPGWLRVAYRTRQLRRRAARGGRRESGTARADWRAVPSALHGAEEATLMTRLVVGAAIVRGGRVLAALRPATSSLPGWEFPGGKVESGEDPAAALAREIDEELGVEVTVGPFLPETVDLPDDWRLIVAPASVVSGEPIPHEHDAIRWLPASELNTLTWLPGDLPFLGRVRELLE